MKLLATILLAILGFYVFVALLTAAAVMLLGGAWDVALKVGFLILFKRVGL